MHHHSDGLRVGSVAPVESHVEVGHMGVVVAQLLVITPLEGGSHREHGYGGRSRETAENT